MEKWPKARMQFGEEIGQPDGRWMTKQPLFRVEAGGQREHKMNMSR